MNRLGKFRSAAVAIVLGASLSLACAQEEETPTPPVGYVTLHVAAGTGVSKTITALSVPLYGHAKAGGEMAGTLTGLSANSLSNSSANWTPGELSAPAAPFVIKLTSGAATGRTFLISTTTPNTATTVTIDAKDVAQGALTTLGIAVGDGYEILPCDTLDSLFGTPETTGIQGGTSVNNADSLIISVNGLFETYYFNTTLGRWSGTARQSPDATHTPLRPDGGILYNRLAASDLELTLSGRVSTTARKTAVRNSNTTILSQNWPLDVTLLDSGIQNIPTWTAAASANTADEVEIIKEGISNRYWFNGTAWQKNASGFPVADGEIIPAGSAILLKQKGREQGYDTLQQPMPYHP